MICFSNPQIPSYIEDFIWKGYNYSKRIMKNFTRSFLITTFRFLFRVLSRVTVSGWENLARQGGYIVAANHLSTIEVPLIYLLIDRDDLSGLVAKKHQKNAFFRFLVNSFNGIWLNREEADAHALRAARDHLRFGGVLGLSPEGTRSPTGALISAKTGVAFLADQANVPIVPAGVAGTYHAMGKILTLRRPKITVKFGKPFCLPPIDRKNKDRSLKENTDEIMCQIAALLPYELRGVYAEYPRTQELLSVQAGDSKVSS
jgi:1-acyl-sn-glycerol-3-phosphate acyltransferase